LLRKGFQRRQSRVSPLTRSRKEKSKSCDSIRSSVSCQLH
jgi:hypothetical protein